MVQGSGFRVWGVGVGVSANRSRLCKSGQVAHDRELVVLPDSR